MLSRRLDVSTFTQSGKSQRGAVGRYWRLGVRYRPFADHVDTDATR